MEDFCCLEVFGYPDGYGVGMSIGAAVVNDPLMFLCGIPDIVQRYLSVKLLKRKKKQIA